ncbi:related to ribonuclease H1 [Rhynchosporium agropyri]|uniref:Ribonuclease H n=1 Tax=Rhynchosporium agropyri TaxID=914238 RepID=A0A1E1LAG1_9HELO|nr:related to ribonuclease H1 [Rhynchosporium agropyri]
MSSGSKKRKLGEDVQKFYAVKAGRTPGVYLSWKECQERTSGYAGAIYKSFVSRKEADDFVAGRNQSNPGQEKFYGVAVGHRPGVYTEWPEAQRQIDGAKNPKYKKFETRREAEEFVRSGGKVSAEKKEKGNVKADAEVGGGVLEVVDGRERFEVEEDVEQPSSKRSRTSGSAEGKGKGKGKMLRIYTDGSALGNGRTGAVAGVGVFFGVNDKRNVSESLDGDVQTNNRAELTGVLRALQIAPKERSVEIITDSNYSINCVTVWYDSWVRRNWIKSDKKAVENQDLIKGIKALMEERDELGAETKFTWIKGHNDDPGNTAADRLAVAGAHASR